MEARYISVQQALQRYGIGRTTLYELFAAEGCPTILKLGGKVMIPVQAFDDFFDALLVPQTTQQHSTREGGAA